MNQEINNFYIKDQEIFDQIKLEEKRQKESINLIASENFVSQDVLKVQGTILTNKYAEGYPEKRFYNGCQYIDEIEKIAIERATELFKAKYANVQPHSGSQANMAVFQALLNPNDRILGLSLSDGGHLTHGSKMNFSGKYYESYFYGLNSKTETIDYAEVEKIAFAIRPKLIITGYSSYSKIIDFKSFRKIANKVNAYLMADIAHISGLVASGLHPCPLEAQADVVTSTTHKTLRGPRGGLILTNNKEIINKINKAVFPGGQGGPLMHIIAAKAVAFKEALHSDFIKYQKQILKNACFFAENLQKKGYRIISKSTENHLFLVDVKSKNPNFTGKKISDILNKVNIVVNKNVIPFDKETPLITSGIRLGTPAMTTRGFKENEFAKVSDFIDEAITNHNDLNYLNNLKQKVITLSKNFPLKI
ncbi:Serine hydroxymethyltransferase [Candidatus Phytoplasma mali]|uniref:Serine hydroxymethyltransferase n=1 Tax=Phytoplasma mali (strain AT) TaxID=482235 RepID=GLYA_PHYMT|nr:serine hydroxymethyltransferase [Candidatus Phytoplasma mali]B3R0G5.1 RecName: Full=Serine hydroxymethyltransferase; Short=SHMT; Short=Serine methylase [Candidatus Phytoplasma mali AT]CAP18329.1 Serine hydroxymethyltransferase [Candidatus Phytoplasma mali]